MFKGFGSRYEGCGRELFFNIFLKTGKYGWVHRANIQFGVALGLFQKCLINFRSQRREAFILSPRTSKQFYMNVLTCSHMFSHVHTYSHMCVSHWNKQQQEHRMHWVMPKRFTFYFIFLKQEIHSRRDVRMNICKLLLWW